MSFHRISFATTVLAVLLSASAGHAEKKQDASSYFANGLRLYAEKNYEEAAVELEKAYEAAPEQRTLFAWAQAVRLSGDCEKSRELLAKYVANGANRKQSKAAFTLMEDCTPAATKDPNSSDLLTEAVDASTKSGTTKPGTTKSGTTTDGTTTIATAPPKPKAEPKQASVTPWYKDWVAVGLFSVGAVGLGVSGLSYSNALSLEADGEANGVSYDEFLDFQERSESKRTLALLTGAAGAVFVGAGVTYLLLRDSSPSQESAVSVQIDAESAGFAFSGHF
tara:strand:+ start:4805 stop:5641 length:837 start_codon:yes stop_codon:yes gene_type:complete